MGFLRSVIPLVGDQRIAFWILIKASLRQATPESTLRQQNDMLQWIVGCTQIGQVVGEKAPLHSWTAKWRNLGT
jgi:hypothetical protein